MSKICLFSSSAGGVGKTTLAMSSCQHLVKQSKKVLLIDFTLYGGLEAIIRKSKRHNGIGSLYDAYEQHLTLPLVEAIVKDDQLGCDVLMNSNALSMEKVSHQFVDHLLNELKSYQYDYILFDTSFELSERNARLFQIADQINFVLTQDITVFWRTLKFYEILDKLMVDRKHIKMVLNKYNKKIPINIKEFEDEIKMTFSATFADEKVNLVNANNEGKLHFGVQTKLTKKYNVAMTNIWEEQ